jgi:hypothetical protein
MNQEAEEHDCCRCGARTKRKLRSRLTPEGPEIYACSYRCASEFSFAQALWLEYERAGGSHYSERAHWRHKAACKKLAVMHGANWREPLSQELRALLAERDAKEPLGLAAT